MNEEELQSWKDGGSKCFVCSDLFLINIFLSFLLGGWCRGGGTGIGVHDMKFPKNQ